MMIGLIGIILLIKLEYFTIWLVDAFSLTGNSKTAALGLPNFPDYIFNGLEVSVPKAEIRTNNITAYPNPSKNKFSIA